MIVPVLEAGQRIFGENYVQEAKAKWPALKERFPDANVHMIGPLQSNKAREAVELFDVDPVARPREPRQGTGTRDRAQRDARRRRFYRAGQHRRRAAEGRRAARPEAIDAFLESCREPLTV